LFLVLLILLLSPHLSPCLILLQSRWLLLRRVFPALVPVLPLLLPVLRLCLCGRPTEDLLGRDATKLAGNLLDWTGIASAEFSLAPAFALLTMIVLRSAAFLLS